MKKQLVHISPHKTGIVLGVLFGFLGLIYVPIIFLTAVFGATTGGESAVFAFVAFLLPVFYAMVGYTGGFILAAVYNLVAKWTGGLEFEVRDDPPAA